MSEGGAHDDLPVRPGLRIPGSELHEKASRAGGPGGQHVNNTSTRVTLRWSVAPSAALSDAQRARISLQLAARLTRDGEIVVHAARPGAGAVEGHLTRAGALRITRSAGAGRDEPPCARDRAQEGRQPRRHREGHEGANHLFVKAVTGSPTEYPTLEKTFVPGLLDEIGEWILTRTR